MQRPEGCLAFFWWFLLFFFLDCSCTGFGLGSGGGRFLAVSSLVASTTTVQTEIVVETSLTLLLLVEIKEFCLVELLEEVSGFFSDFCWDLLSLLGVGLLEWDFSWSRSQ